MVTIKTSMGDIKLELLEEEAPETVRNFLSYLDGGHYNGTIFHRVINNFMIQGGGFDVSFTQLPTKATIQNEADNRVENKSGTVAMARTPDPHSASSQFFINVADNDFLNYKSSTPDGYGYCVFARVVDGMDVVEKIKEVETGNKGAHGDVPVEDVLINEIIRD